MRPPLWRSCRGIVLHMEKNGTTPDVRGSGAPLPHPDKRGVTVDGSPRGTKNGNTTNSQIPRRPGKLRAPGERDPGERQCQAITAGLGRALELRPPTDRPSGPLPARRPTTGRSRLPCRGRSRSCGSTSFAFISKRSFATVARPQQRDRDVRPGRRQPSSSYSPQGTFELLVPYDEVGGVVRGPVDARVAADHHAFSKLHDVECHAVDLDDASPRVGDLGQRV